MAEANRLSKLLTLSRGSDRFPVDVEELAKQYAEQFVQPDPIAHVIGQDLPGFEGALYSAEDRNEWALIFNSAIPVPGRIRFTVAHEFGHYILHRRWRDSFECSQEDMLRWESKERQMEAEADTFAACLLMPIDDYRARIGHDVVDLNLLQDCAQWYGVSLTAAVLKWLEFTPQRAVLVVSRDGFILWARSSQAAFKSGMFFRTRGQVVPVPAGSLAANSNAVVSERQGIELAAQVWFPREPRDMAMREMKILSDRYDQTMSLLIFPKEEPRYWRSVEEESEAATLDEHIRSGHFPTR